jgi:hypothetical protein
MGERENHVIFKALVDITMVMLNRNMVAKVELSEYLTFFVSLNINLLNSKNSDLLPKIGPNSDHFGQMVRILFWSEKSDQLVAVGIFQPSPLRTPSLRKTQSNLDFSKSPLPPPPKKNKISTYFSAQPTAQLLLTTIKLRRSCRAGPCEKNRLYLNNNNYNILLPNHGSDPEQSSGSPPRAA